MTCPLSAARLTLPEGWRYETRTLTDPLTVDTSTRKRQCHAGRPGQQLLTTGLTGAMPTDASVNIQRARRLEPQELGPELHFS